MRVRHAITALGIFCLLLTLGSSCRHRSSAFVIVLSDKFSTLDPIVSLDNQAANERIRLLLFNTLVRKNERFEYVGELATEIRTSADGLVLTLPLRTDVKFHDGRLLTSADCKYSLDTLLASPSTKAASFFDTVKDDQGKEAKVPRIVELSAPDAATFVIKLRSPADRQKIVSSLVTIGIIPNGSAAQQAKQPLGSGPFKFVRYDETQLILDLEANPNYWEGASSLPQVRVKVVQDASSLQLELKSGRVDLVPLPTNLTADTLTNLALDPKLQVLRFPSANVAYIGFNTQQKPLDDVRVRQAIGFAINREKIIHELLHDQAKLAHSILPEESWAFSAGQKYNYDPAHAKQLLDEAGFRDPDGDGPQMRFKTEIEFKFAANSAATAQYAQVIQSDLQAVGIPVRIATVEFGVLTQQLRLGQYQMTVSRWIGGNQDPIFLRDLFASSEIPDEKRGGFNRWRYKNSALDVILDHAFLTTERNTAIADYAKAQDIISQDVPLLPLWYPANMVVAQKRVGNVKVDASGDWAFIRALTVQP